MLSVIVLQKIIFFIRIIITDNLNGQKSSSAGHTDQKNWELAKKIAIGASLILYFLSPLPLPVADIPAHSL